VWQAFRRLARKPAAWAGGILIMMQFLVALAGPPLIKADPQAMKMAERLQPPSEQHWFGTDEFGRDQFARIVYGSRLSLRIGIISVGIALALGGTVGLLAGYLRGTFELLAMGLMDVLMAFPALLLALAIVAVLGPGLENTMIAVGIATTPAFARVLRSSALVVREQVYVEAARAVGATTGRVLLRHVIPNVMPSIIVLVTLAFPSALLSAAALGFVGLGAQPPTPEWGAMLVGARTFINRAPWLVNIPGLAIVLTVLSYNLLGDALRDVLDPTQRHG
jgi:peptide/nickel transport system permease protein